MPSISWGLIVTSPGSWPVLAYLEEQVLHIIGSSRVRDIAGLRLAWTVLCFAVNVAMVRGLLAKLPEREPDSRLAATVD